MERRLAPDPELDALVQDLNTRARGETEMLRAADSSVTEVERRSAPTPSAGWTLARADETGHAFLQDLLQRARARHASDLLIVPGHPPTVRINGRLEALSEGRIRAGEVEMLCAALTPQRRRQAACEDGAVDFSIQPEGLGRFRCNLHRQRDAWSVAIRLLGDDKPTLQSLNLPPELASYAELERGLVLVTGPTGSGKSTTLAAMIRHVLERRAVHLITVEDPVEYEHEHDASVVEHIEVGRDVRSFPEALRSAVRQDPDVLLVGEMRDSASMSMAITAAETGHLVFSTLHTGNAPQAVHRILDGFPAAQQDQIRAQISISLAGIVSQQLLPRADGNGRVPAVENLVATHAVRNQIRRNKIEILRSQLALERSAGMISFDESLAGLAKTGKVESSEARQRAVDPREFDRLL